MLPAVVSLLPMLRPEPVCPKATQDVALNLQNRRKAIQVAKYGPANPRLPNELYWRQIASEWGVSVEEAKTMRCGNCAAFDISPEIRACISKGLAEDGVDPADTIVAAELGYCHAFKFKCAASRTCSAWIVGGPIREHRTHHVDVGALTRRPR